LGPIPQATANRPPQVAISFPRPPWSSGIVSSYIRLKAEASDPDGFVRYIQFFVGTNLVGVSTAPPFSVVWYADAPPPPQIWRTTVTAVAVDDLGASGRSDPVPIAVVSQGQIHPTLEIVSPSDGDVFAAPATFDFRVQFLVSGHSPDITPFRPILFQIGTNSVYASTNSPLLTTVTNLPEGTYTLKALNFEALTDGPRPITIRVANVALRGRTEPLGGRASFGACNLEPGARSIIQRSTDLRTWAPVLTNSAASFYFLDELTNHVPYFYRLFSQPTP
jgi:hypothetical protein